MLVQVGLLSGEVKQYNLADGTKAGELAQIISQEQGIDISLVQCGEEVSLNSDLNGETTYYVNVDAEGGKKKKKKRKAFTTKKKTKHRHRKIKLLTLKLYQVDKNGAVSRTHKQCPVCPGGVYMGKHFDRHYCGTCHQTLRMDEATIKANLEALKKQQKAKEAAGAVKAADTAADKKGGKKDAKKGKKK